MSPNILYYNHRLSTGKEKKRLQIGELGSHIWRVTIGDHNDRSKTPYVITFVRAKNPKGETRKNAWDSSNNKNKDAYIFTNGEVAKYINKNIKDALFWEKAFDDAVYSHKYHDTPMPQQMVGKWVKLEHFYT